MNFIILTEAGTDIGLGHLTRCLSLYEEIESRNFNVKIFVFGDLENKSLLQKKNHESLNWINVNFFDNKISNFDYIIIDSYIANQEIYNTIYKLTKKILIIDDFERLNYPRSIVLNPAIKKDYSDLFLNNHLVLKGLDYVIVRKEFLNKQFHESKLHAKDVLVMIGGMDNQNIIPIIIKEICKTYSNINFHIVLNKDSNNLEKKNTEKNIFYYTDLSSEEISKLMSEIDFAICSSGQTIYELIYLKKPFISIQVAENQLNNVKFLKDKVSDKLVLTYKDEFLIDKLSLLFDELCEIERREEISLKMENLIDGYGTKRVIDFLISNNNFNLEFEIRKVIVEDISEIYKLSNSEYVRKFSINSSEISWDSHIKWFDTILEKSNNEFYIVTNKEKEFLGQIRFNIDNSIATMSISFKEKILGKGLSKIIATKSIGKLLTERSEVNIVIAHISKDNLPSQKLFKKLNFRIVDSNNNFDKLSLERKDFYENT